MGIDWEEILDADGDYLQGEAEDNDFSNAIDKGDENDNIINLFNE